MAANVLSSPQTNRPTTKTTPRPTTTTPHPHIDSSTLKWQGLLAVINSKKQAYCLTYQNLKAGSKVTFAKCDNSSSTQQWVTAQLWNATDAPWNACLLNNIQLCDSIDAQGQGVLAASNLNDKKQHWYYNWVTNQYKNGGVGATQCSRVILGSDKITPIGTIFKPCNSDKLQKWYFPYYIIPSTASME